MRPIIFLLCLSLVSTISFAQSVTAADALSPEKDYTLEERYRIMRDKSPTYNSYKEIKGYVLDGMWKLTMDSINEQKAAVRQANAKITELQTEISNFQASVQQKDKTIEEMAFDSSHIRVIGISMQKDFFVTVVSIVLLGLLSTIGVVVARLKWVRRHVKEKVDAANQLSIEYEEYKRKALEKQMKLSRELQNERNRLQEMRSS